MQARPPSEKRSTPRSGLQPDLWLHAGRVIFAAALGVFGLLYLLYVAGLSPAAPGPPWYTPTHVLPASLFGALLGAAFLVAAICIAGRQRARPVAAAVGVVLLLLCVGFYLPRVVMHIHNPGPWTSGFEMLALAGGSLSLAAALPSALPRPSVEARIHTLGLIGRVLFALALVVFGVQHIYYAVFVATLIPAWMPGHLFWAYATGAAFLLAACSLLSRIYAPLAASLLAAMFLLWVLMLHLPRVAAAPGNGNEWTSAGIALAMGGLSAALAGATQPRPTQSESMQSPLDE